MASRKVITEDNSIIMVENEVPYEFLSEKERYIWSAKDVILKSIGGLPDGVKGPILVETISYRSSSQLTQGCYDLQTKEIFISRMCLRKMESFLAVLSHEIAHSKCLAYDGTVDFEKELTHLLGYIGTSLVNATGNNAYKVKTANSLDSENGAYVSCKCMTCFGSEFEHNEDLSYVKCKSCGREYMGGYNELVNLNRQYVEKNGELTYLFPDSRTNTNNNMRHLDYFGVPINGTLKEFLDCLTKSNLISPVSDLARMTYEENFGGEGPFNLVGEKFLDIEGCVGFVSPSDSGQIMKVDWMVPSLFGNVGMNYIADKLKPHYGEPTVVGSVIAWYFDYGSIMIVDSGNPEYGIIVGFSDKANSDFEDL